MIIRFILQKLINGIVPFLDIIDSSKLRLDILKKMMGN
ncbi:hypothetical protein PAGA_a1609 [Pseudoalteromonas agarivorans DSM 14585]|uniref:Uncharacterized protein n=1 Tax=Pseudoalteromonas agarivorans DSM 14585 TaxID=1312369 RepID=A0ACA8DVY4_9GAMM|nr:hypothetical protein PAGA_a1609 [Pseudoalteromonas agarivorans DSM 14585]